MPLVEFFPAFEALQPDPLGHLWVQEYRYPGQDRNVWTVFDADGRVQGFVETPPGLDVFEIGEDYILGLMTDEFDVERVQLWPLDRIDGERIMTMTQGMPTTTNRESGPLAAAAEPRMAIPPPPPAAAVETPVPWPRCARCG